MADDIAEKLIIEVQKILHSLTSQTSFSRIC